MANRNSGAPARLRRALVAVTLALGFASVARADFISIASDTAFSQAGNGTFTGSISYTSQLGGESGTLLITLTNTSALFGGGYITGFVFNVASSDPDATVTLVNGPDHFDNAPNQNAGPFGGRFDAGAALGGVFMGGGNFNKGIASGETQSFEFELDADDAALLSAVDFMSGPLPHNFVVRYRGFIGGGSDLVPAQGSAIPGPSALVAIALFTALVRWRKRIAV
jgi:hypothetical protein